MKKLKVIGLVLLCFVTGLMFFAMAFTDPDFTAGSRIFAIFCGLLFIVVSLLYRASNLAGLREEREKRRKRRKAKDYIFSFYETVEDRTDTDRLLSRFRKDYAEFFKTHALEENSGLQFDSTQLYWNIAALQKKRLEKKGIVKEFYSERKNYTGMENVSVRNRFDGKYDVTEYTESIATKTVFTREENPVYTKQTNQVAHFVATSAKQQGDGQIICPSCGAATTRENLIDGCDYCGTKFAVVDLNTKISSFRLRDDYRIQYEKYKLARLHYNEIVFVGQFIVYLLLCMGVYFFWMGADEIREIGGNMITGILGALLASAMAAGMFAYLGLLFFWVAIFPLIQIKASVTFASKKRINRMKRSAEKDAQAEQTVKKFDPLFSVAAFYAGIHNKLATIHFADTQTAVQAFFEEDKPELTSRYHDVIDMDMEEIGIADYSVANGLQQIRVDTTLALLEDTERGIKKRREKLALTLIRADTCKTQEICGPAVFRCRGCGTSLALETGKTCPMCGHAINFKQYDWIIKDYQIV